MNKYSSIVLWIGLILIILNLAKNWTVLKDIIYAGANMPPTNEKLQPFNPQRNLRPTKPTGGTT